MPPAPAVSRIPVRPYMMDGTEDQQSQAAVMHIFRIAATLAALASPALAWDRPEDVTGAYRLASPGGDAVPCEMELLAPIAYEFEGVWYVARPLHYDDNRAACRRLGVEDIVAWSGLTGQSIWLLAEGEAGFMEFTPVEGGWRLSKSGHETQPDLVLSKAGDDD